MKKRKANRITPPVPVLPLVYFFVTEYKNKIVVISIDGHNESLHSCDGVIEAMRYIREARKKLTAGRGSLAYVVSTNLVSYGRLSQLTMQRASDLYNVGLVNSMSDIYNWINGHSLHSLPGGRPPARIKERFVKHLREYQVLNFLLGIQ